LDLLPDVEPLRASNEGEADKEEDEEELVAGQQQVPVDVHNGFWVGVSDVRVQGEPQPYRAWRRNCRCDSWRGHVRGRERHIQFKVDMGSPGHDVIS
jgi:hypothetical protein